MYRNYITIALRNILKYKGFSLINIAGLASFTASQRTKEIGIRKVLGASFSGILVLLNKDFAKRLLVANLIAWPLAYYAMNKWLQNFAYRIQLNIWMFLVSAAAALFIALFTVSYQTIRAARSDGPLPG